MGWVVAGKDDDNEDRWVQEHTNNPAHRADTSLDETTAGATASMPTDVATPHYDPAKATRDWGHHQTTSMSAWSVLL